MAQGQEPTQEQWQAFISALQNGEIPPWNPSDETEARAYVTAYNTLLGREALGLYEVRRYAFCSIDENGNPIDPFGEPTELPEGAIMLIPVRQKPE